MTKSSSRKARRRIRRKINRSDAPCKKIVDLSLVYEQQLDYAVFSGGWEIGRIFQETDSLPEHKWSWAILMNGPIGKRYDCVGSLEEAEEQLRGAWGRWKAWAKLEEVP